MLKNDFSDKKYEIVDGFNSSGFILFNVSHWMFAFKYYSMSRQSSYKIAKQEVPQRILKHDRITNWVFLTLNTLPPILLGVGYIGYHIANTNNHADFGKKLLKLGKISRLVSLFVPIISGVYLFTALYKINKSVKSQDDTQVNLKAMALHATSFGLFMASTLFFIFVYVMDYYFDRMTGKVFYISGGATIICSSLAQIVLCFIFWELR
jgi:hypothetical protein